MNNTCIVDPDAPAAKLGHDVWMWLAYFCLLGSYININILVFRIFLTLAAVFFIIFGSVPERAVQVDTVVFNAVYILINIFQSIPLVKQIWPVKLTEFEEEIYERDFKDHMNKRQFKKFIKEFKTQTFDAPNSHLCDINSQYGHLIYVAKLSPKWKINLKRNETSKIHELTESSWIGIIEYMDEMNRKPNDPKTKWNVTATLEENKDFNENYIGTQNEELIPVSGEGCVVYFIEIDVFFNLFIYFGIET